MLDCSAVLAYLRQEPGADIVAACLPGAMLSTVNFCEVLTTTAAYGGDCELTREVLESFDVRFIHFSSEHATIAAHLQTQARSHGLSLADRACLALGIAERHDVVTADRVWAKLEIAATVRLIR